MNKVLGRKFLLAHSGWIFKNTPIFSDIPDSVIQEYFRNATISHYKKGLVVFKAGELLEEALILIKGLAALLQNLRENRFVTVGLVAPIEPLGLIAAIQGIQVPLTCTAFSECSILRLPLQDFKDLSRAVPAIADKLMKIGATRFRVAQERLREVLTIGSHERVHRAIDILLSTPAACSALEVDEVCVTRRQLAELAGVTTETSIRATSLLELYGAISFPKRGKIKVCREKFYAYRVQHLLPEGDD